MAERSPAYKDDKDSIPGRSTGLASIPGRRILVMSRCCRPHRSNPTPRNSIQNMTSVAVCPMCLRTREGTENNSSIVRVSHRGVHKTNEKINEGGME